MPQTRKAKLPCNSKQKDTGVYALSPTVNVFHVTFPKCIVAVDVPEPFEILNLSPSASFSRLTSRTG